MVKELLSFGPGPGGINQPSIGGAPLPLGGGPNCWSMLRSWPNDGNPLPLGGGGPLPLPFGGGPNCWSILKSWPNDGNPLPLGGGGPNIGGSPPPFGGRGNWATADTMTTAISRRMVFDILKVVKAEKYGCGALILSNRHFWWIGCKTLKVKFNHLILFYL